MQSDLCYLEKLRLEEGAETCRAAFEQVYRKNRMQASSLVNDSRLTFPTLYLLHSSLEPKTRSMNLNLRNRRLIYILGEMKRDSSGNKKIPILTKKDPNTRNILLWTVKTGCRYDGDDTYDMVLDTFCCILFQTYQLSDALPYAEHMLFTRNRQGKNIHDLTWACFQLHNAEVLRHMAEHLQANDPLERELACELLDTDHICPHDRDKQAKYEHYRQWLDENDGYLYFTEENLLFSRHPRIFDVDEDRKFLQRSPRDYEKLAAQNLPQQEKHHLEELHRLPAEDRRCLCRYSHRMRRKDQNAWSKWMQCPMNEKLNAARQEQEDKV